MVVVWASFNLTYTYGLPGEEEYYACSLFSSFFMHASLRAMLFAFNVE
jgi:hypothetical protein